MPSLGKIVLSEEVSILRAQQMLQFCNQKTCMKHLLAFLYKLHFHLYRLLFRRILKLLMTYMRNCLQYISTTERRKKGIDHPTRN